MYYLHLLLVRLHRNRGVQSAFNALYGLHLMHINRGTDCIVFQGTDCTVFEVDLQHRNRGNPKTWAFISGTSFKVVRLHLKQAVQYGLDWVFLGQFGTKIKNSRLLFMHRNQGSEMVLEISWICTVFLSDIFAEENKISLLSLTGFPRGGFSRAYLAKNLWVKFLRCDCLYLFSAC